MAKHHVHTKTSRDPECLLCQALDRSRERGLRMTKALEDVLRILIESNKPLTLADIAESKNLSSQADRATVYRLVTKLEKLVVILSLIDI